MRFEECFEYLIRRRTDELVITSAGSVSELWWQLTQEQDSVFYLEASMGLVSMFAAGLALGVPQQRIWAFSGDGGFCMNPGMLMVERQLNLPNLVHFLVSNRCYGSTSQVSLPNADSNDYPALARAMGIERVYSFESLAALEAGFDEVVNGQRPTFIVLELEPLAEKHSAAPVDGSEQKFRFGRYVEKTCGIRVFDY
jgi:thiamine pyrophosphate-dependent acetolactate synthase large subunit-like protein